MKQSLVIVRHAKSLHEEYVERDIERHLSARGYSDAKISAVCCAKEGLLPDLIISSPAIRAYSTALIFANTLGYEAGKIQLHDSIYNAGVTQLLNVLGEINKNHKTIMLFGHNPGLTDLINELCGPVILHLPTASVAWLSGYEKLKSKAKLEKCFSGHKETE